MPLTVSPEAILWPMTLYAPLVLVGAVEEGRRRVLPAAIPE